tara:strand:+ start:4346 stop:4573 length:228 start_codon:yes stop_codon:yes gene_type:complete
MKIENPFTKGTSAYQNFDSGIQFNKDFGLEELQRKLKAVQQKADNWMNLSLSQRDSYDQEITMLKSLIEHKNSAA